MAAVAERTTEISLAYADQIKRTRIAQQKWAETDIRTRLRVVRAMRTGIARHASALVHAFAPELRARPAERLASELIPLAEACRFLEEAPQVLAPRVLTRKTTPFWLRRIRVEEHREPLGVVLVIGPSNYPLFLPAVQAIQALTAGNAVFVKPGAGGLAALRLFRDVAVRADLAPDLLQVLDESPASAQVILAHGIDKVVLTGSLGSGRAVYRAAAERLTPAILELSGEDPVFILPSADLERAVEAIAFGLRWNEGQTCIAPRRIFVNEAVAETFAVLFAMKCPGAQDLPIVHFRSDKEALALASQSPFALGAAVFGEPGAARAFAQKIRAGVVVVNDMILPTADPRVAFGGRGHSGFGTTRGAEGLREFTALKVVVVQRAKRLRHMEPLPANAEELFRSYLTLSHVPGWRERLRSLGRLVRAIKAQRKS